MATPLVAGGGIGRDIFVVTRAARTPSVEAVLAAVDRARAAVLV